MAELAETVKQSAENAGTARDISQAARDQAEDGGLVVERAVAAMENINKSSSKIADIIGVIDEIAFQTNLLALNAAVEAARAGDQGRGFAVVASEVRSLAQRSAESAKEIKGLIKESGQRVAEGSELVNESGKSLREIVGAVRKVSDVVGEISGAAKEQAESIDQVSAAVAQLDEVTQQNAALVEQVSAASESLDEQAVSLRQLMQSFKLSRRAEVEADVPDRRDPQSVGSVLRGSTGAPGERCSASGSGTGAREGF
jgi:methyl-accepting chemotaxis protein